MDRFDDAANPGDPADDTPGNVPDSLQNWQVIEDDEWLADQPGLLVEGRAAPVASPGDEAQVAEQSQSADVWPGDPGGARQPIADHHDDVIVVSLHDDCLTVQPGETATFRVDVLNNGRNMAVFQLHVEGWVDEAWVTVAPVRTQLQPGERAALDVAVTPARASTSAAGEHPLAIVTRSPDYPDRYSRLGATLVIAPYAKLAVGDLRPRRMRAGWSRRAALFHLPLTNHGNAPLRLTVRGEDITRALHFEFAQPDVGAWRAEEAHVTLKPGQTLSLRGRVLPERPRLIGLRRETLGFRLAVTSTDPGPDAGAAPQTIPGRVENRPLVGPWHAAAAVTLILAAGLFALLAGMGGLLLLQLAQRSAPTPAPPPVAAPVIAVMLNTDAFMPDEATAAQPDPVSMAEAVSAPRVEADQVSAPAAAANQPAPSIPPQQPAPDAGLTYGEMFQLAARPYDLDWRMLAAIAYIESNFDALALGADGDLGLMQVLPDTWREWAPQAGVSDPFDSYSNALVAAAYLDYLRTLLGERGYGDAKWMLVAYNWGPDKLLAHLNAGQAWEQLAEPRRRYADRVLELAGNIPTQ